MQSRLRLAFDRTRLGRAVRVALFVGTALALINHYDAIFTFTFDERVVWKIGLTYLVPFLVSLHGQCTDAAFSQRGAYAPRCS